MLTFRQLDDIPEGPISESIAGTAERILADMARRIAQMDFASPATQWQLSRLAAISAEHDSIVQELARLRHISESQLVQVFDEAATRALASDDKLYKAAGYSPTPLPENRYLQQIIQAGVSKTQGEFFNLTRTTANTATRQFEKALDAAHQDIAFGGFDYQTSIKRAVQSLAKSGLSAINYPSGHIDSLDVATRRAILTGVHQTAAELQIARLQEMGTDLVETTAHPGARPEHAVWQGKVFSYSGTHKEYPAFVAATGYGTGAGLCGWNCRHSFFPFFEGLSEPAHTAGQLREYNSKTVKYGDKELNLYEATQHQRYIERQVRRWKREAAAMEEAGLDAGQAKKEMREWQATQRDFIKQTGLRRDYFRERAGVQNYETPSENAIIKLQIKDTGITGTIHVPRRQIDTSLLDFDAEHVNVERGHGVTSEEAKSFIDNAVFSVTRWSGQYENYYSYDGAAYVDIPGGFIRTAYRAKEFTEDVKKMMEVIEGYGK